MEKVKEKKIADIYYVFSCKQLCPDFSHCFWALLKVSVCSFRAVGRELQSLGALKEK